MLVEVLIWVSFSLLKLTFPEDRPALPFRGHLVSSRPRLHSGPPMHNDEKTKFCLKRRKTMSDLPLKGQSHGRWPRVLTQGAKGKDIQEASAQVIQSWVQIPNRYARTQR